MTLCQSQLQFLLTCSAVGLSRSNRTGQHARGLQLSREGLAAASSGPLSQKTGRPHQLTEYKIFKFSICILQAQNHGFLQWNNAFKRVLLSQNSKSRPFRGHTQKDLSKRVEKAYTTFPLLRTQNSITHLSRVRSQPMTLTKSQSQLLVRSSDLPCLNKR